jgi:hypothetical protein
MPNENETRRRKEIYDRIRREKQAQEEAAMPIAKERLKELFDYIN